MFLVSTSFLHEGLVSFRQWFSSSKIRATRHSDLWRACLQWLVCSRGGDTGSQMRPSSGVYCGGPTSSAVRWSVRSLKWFGVDAVR